MELSMLRDSNPWWENEQWDGKDFHLVNVEKQKIKWNYKVLDKLDEGIYSLRGPRQVGKTSWIKQKIRELLKKGKSRNILFYSCDNINSKELSEIIELFFELSEQGKKFIFLDEIPFVENWEFVLKHYYDLGKFKDCFILVCGSNSLDIKKSTERMPGRGDKGKRHLIMAPLLFSEYLEAIGVNLNLKGVMNKDEAELKLKFNELKKAYKNYLMTGGFLKIINEYEETKNILDSSYDVYLKWIIGDLAKWNLKENYAKQILRRVLETYTSEISWSSISKGTDIDTHNTTSKYAEALEEMFILQVLYKMEFNKKIPAYPKSKKIYFSDPFILAAIYKWINSADNNFNKYSFFLEENIDKINEGVLLNHIIKILLSESKSDIFKYSDIVYYWSNKAKTKEVDFVYNSIAFEVKYQNNINKEDYNALKEFKKYYLITKHTFNKNTYPIAVFLILLEKYNLLKRG